MTKINPNEIFEILYHDKQARNKLENALESIFDAKVKIKITDEKETEQIKKYLKQKSSNDMPINIIRSNESLLDKLKDQKDTNPFEEAYDKVYNEGYDDGLADGICQKEEEIARNMIDLNFDAKTIAEIIDVSEEYVESI